MARRPPNGRRQMGRPLSPGGEYGKRSISGAQQGCGETWIGSQTQPGGAQYSRLCYGRKPRGPCVGRRLVKDGFLLHFLRLRAPQLLSKHRL
jgi:hypothetical protein